MFKLIERKSAMGIIRSMNSNRTWSGSLKSVVFLLMALSFTHFAQANNSKDQNASKAYYSMPKKAQLTSLNGNMGVRFYKFEEGYLVVAVDKDFTQDVMMFKNVGGYLYRSGGLELKFKTRLETDDEIIMRLGEEEKGFFDGKPQQKGESYESFIRRVGEKEFKRLAKGGPYGYTSNADNTKPAESRYRELFHEVAIIASNGIFRFAIVEL